MNSPPIGPRIPVGTSLRYCLARAESIIACVSFDTSARPLCGMTTCEVVDVEFSAQVDSVTIESQVS